ncbi:MAG: hypothetical protein IIB00_03755 [candidate division Zixibacteria bacterium]|nr:hypothetical protein [candidate division Zixibacteria bacterium]
MKALTRFGVLAAILLVAQLATNCSSPLESLEDPVKNPPFIIHDTVIVTDTLFLLDSIFITDTLVQIDTILQIDTVIINDSIVLIDTLILIDTLVQIDTLLQIDTVFIVDTVIVDTSDALSFCGILNSRQQEVVWLFRNAAGSYRLEFSGFIEKTRPPKEITIFVGDKSYIWFPTESMEFIFEQDLDQNVIVKLSSLPANSFGHDLHVCLTLVPL